MDDQATRVRNSFRTRLWRPEPAGTVFAQLASRVFQRKSHTTAPPNVPSAEPTLPIAAVGNKQKAEDPVGLGSSRVPAPDPSRTGLGRRFRQSARLGPGPTTAADVLTAIEVMSFFACVLLDIWRWQHSHPHLWIGLIAAMVSTHLVHRDNWRTLGLTTSQLRENAAISLRVVLPPYLLLLIWGLASGRLGLHVPTGAAVRYFFGYGVWCVGQQYLTQSYFHNRLMSLIRNRHLSSLLVAVMFAAAHLPNPVLTVATAAAGFVFSELFARHRNIWPLALAQTVGGILIAAITPAALIHNMRVGPGYWTWSG